LICNWHERGICRKKENDLCSADINTCKNGGICFNTWAEVPPKFRCECKGPWTGPTCEVFKGTTTSVPETTKTTSAQCAIENQLCEPKNPEAPECCPGLTCVEIYGSLSKCKKPEPTTPEPTKTTSAQCAIEGEFCKSSTFPWLPECCDGLTCKSTMGPGDKCQKEGGFTSPPLNSTDYTRPTYAPPSHTTTPEPTMTTSAQCAIEGGFCKTPSAHSAYSYLLECCDGLTCRLTDGEVFTCQKEGPSAQCAIEGDFCKSSSFPWLPECCDGLTCKSTMGPGDKCQKESGTTSPPIPTIPTDHTRPTITPDRDLFDQCQKAGQPCKPGTKDRESSMKCCPNHLCDLDNNVCIRVAFRSLKQKEDLKEVQSSWSVWER